MKKTLTMSLAALGVAGMIGGGTFAAWNDADVITDNETAAGHLLLNVNSTGKISNVGGQSIAPGESRTIDFFLTSADLDGVPTADLFVTFQNLRDLENGCLDPESEAGDTTCGTDPDQGEFSDQAYVRVRYSDPAPVGDITWGNNQCSAPSGAINSIGYSPASNNDPTVYPRLDSIGGPSNIGTLAANEGICLRVDLGLDVNADNTTMSDSTLFDLKFDLVQS